jgi:hypothetical protein
MDLAMAVRADHLAFLDFLPQFPLPAAGKSAHDRQLLVVVRVMEVQRDGAALWAILAPLLFFVSPELCNELVPAPPVTLSLLWGCQVESLVNLLLASLAGRLEPVASLGLTMKALVGLDKLALAALFHGRPCEASGVPSHFIAPSPLAFMYGAWGRL